MSEKDLGGACIFSFDEIMQLIDKLSSSEVDEFKATKEGESLLLKKHRDKVVSVETAVGTEIRPEPTPAPVETAAAESAEIEASYMVKSPIVGTFYSSKEEGGEPLVKVGDKVKKDSVVAIIEAMKLMNEITAGADGEIVEILVSNGQLVEYGQELMKIK